MKNPIRSWRNVLVLPALIGFFSSSAVASAATPQAIKPSSQESRAFQKDTVVAQSVQTSSGCRLVAAEQGSGLYIRQEPSVYSDTLGTLENGQTVTIEGRGTENWAQISSPLPGYVFRGFLIPCQAATTSSACREVSALNGLYVRQSPSMTSSVISGIPYGETVVIENPGEEGWVPISEPVEGYVSAAYLAYCP